MNNAIQHIEEQLEELQQLSNNKDRVWASGVLHGLCAAYFRMGRITQHQWEEVSIRAEDTAMSAERLSLLISGLKPHEQDE